jgi:MFS family permease
MAVVLNNLFFPPSDSHAQTLLTAFAFCSSFIFRPFGAMIFGYIGDKYGRKITVVITTFMMAITCLIMAMAPTYEQIGIAAAWIVTFCRIMQGMSSMGEITAARMYLTEGTPLSVRFPVVGLISIAADLGGMLAIAVGVLATSYGFNWRIAFWIGAGIAIIGSIARTTLRESVEYADGLKRMQGFAQRVNATIGNVKTTPFYNNNRKVNPKTALAYFLIQCSGPISVYFIYFYSSTVLQSRFNYDAHQVFVHNLLLAVVQVLGWSMLITYLSTKFHPLKILRLGLVATSIFILFLPWLLSHASTPWQFFLIQSYLIISWPATLPAEPIFYKSFPIFKRFTAASLLYALAYGLAYTVTAFGLTYLIQYFGYWGLLVLMVPALVGYGYGLHYFIEQERKAERYPVLKMWDIQESISKEGVNFL